MVYGMVQSGNTREGHEALLNEFRAKLPAEVQAGVLQYVTNNPELTPAEVAGLMRDTLAEYGQANGLVAAPSGMELMTEVGMLGQQFANGLTTTTSQDIERLTFAVQATVKQMIAAGASDDAIQQAVGNLPGVTPELSQLAQQVAQQQLDAEKFALIDTRNNEPAAAAEPPLTLAVIFDTPMMELAAPQAAVEQQAAQVNPFAALLTGHEGILASFASMQGDAPSVSRASTGLLGTQLASQTQPRELGEGWVVT